MNGQHTYHEIISQPEAWADALAAFTAVAPTLSARWHSLNPAQVIFTGCGSTHYLALTAAALFQQLTGVPSRGCAASELLLFGQTVLAEPARTLLVAISRSGTTSETLTAVSQFRKRGGTAVWTITCYPDSPLTQMSDVVLPAIAAQEQSVAQTRSFASMLLLAQALAAHLGGEDWTVLHDLPGYGRDLLSHTEPIMQNLAGRHDLAPEFGQVEKLVEADELAIGASSIITACGAARLGLKVAFVGVVGDDVYGRYLLHALQERYMATGRC